MLLARGVHEDVVAVSFDPRDVVDRDEEGAFGFADEEALGIAAIALNLLQQMLQTGFGAVGVGVSGVSEGAMESFPEAILRRA